MGENHYECCTENYCNYGSVLCTDRWSNFNCIFVCFLGDAGSSKGSGEYPIGMTMDIYEYRGKYSFDPKSVRDEILPGESELMDDKPVDPSRIKMTAVSCRSCGASYQAAAGYTGRCPYCGSYQDVRKI